ncbi:MAG: hypothetical protein R2845_09460 [Thermomicrobiales bacterium]
MPRSVAQSPTAAIEIIATGLRNPVGLAFQPGTDLLWATVNERDNQGNEIPPDLVTIVLEGANYERPDCFPAVEGLNEADTCESSNRRPSPFRRTPLRSGWRSSTGQTCRKAIRAISWWPCMVRGTASLGGAEASPG